ncbi:hypothetical protein PCE1_000359 [Barthelona sp. PCE]
MVTPKYTWSESLRDLTLVISIIGVRKEGLNVLPSELFLSVSFENYLLTLDLKAEINSSNTNIILRPSELVIVLEKRVNRMWDELIHKCPEEERAARRAASVEKYIELQEQITQTKREEYDRLKNEEFHRQWDLEKEDRARNEEKKKQEMEKLAEELRKWQEEALKHKVTYNTSTEAEREAIPVRKGRIKKIKLTETNPNVHARASVPETLIPQYEGSFAEEMLKRRADNLFRAGNIINAIEMYETVITQNQGGPGNVCVACLNCSVAYIKKNNLEKAFKKIGLAENTFSEFLRKNNASIEQCSIDMLTLHLRVQRVKCMLLFKKNVHLKCAKSLKTALSLVSGFNTANEDVKSFIVWASDVVEEIQSSYESAIRRFYSCGHWAKCVSMGNAVLKVFPNSKSTILNLSLVYHSLNRVTDFLNCFNTFKIDNIPNELDKIALLRVLEVLNKPCAPEHISLFDFGSLNRENCIERIKSLLFV